MDHLRSRKEPHLHPECHLHANDYYPCHLNTRWDGIQRSNGCRVIQTYKPNLPQLHKSLEETPMGGWPFWPFGTRILLLLMLNSTKHGVWAHYHNLLLCTAYTLFGTTFPFSLLRLPQQGWGRIWLRLRDAKRNQLSQCLDYYSFSFYE